MSYRCEECNFPVPANTVERRIVVETRPKKYPARQEAHREIQKLLKYPEHRDDPGGQGFETVSELRVCEECYSHRLASAESKPCPECKEMIGGPNFPGGRDLLGKSLMRVRAKLRAEEE